jgi:predicted secreted Zn-dependent protease
MRFSHIVIISALAVISGCSSTTVTRDTYEVSGNTGKQLDRSIAKNAPMRGHAFAATQLQILPASLIPVEDANGCRLRTAKFKVIANITMPKWRNRAGAPKDLKQGFDAFSDYAHVHENVHVKIGEYAARAMEDAVLHIPAQPNCDRLAAKVKSTIKKIHAQHHKAQLAFDAAEDKRIRKLLATAAR